MKSVMIVFNQANTGRVEYMFLSLPKSQRQKSAEREKTYQLRYPAGYLFFGSPLPSSPPASKTVCFDS